MLVSTEESAVASVEAVNMRRGIGGLVDDDTELGLSLRPCRNWGLFLWIRSKNGSAFTNAGFPFYKIVFSKIGYCLKSHFCGNIGVVPKK